MLLIEENFNNVEVLQESIGEENEKKIFFSGVFGIAEEKNRNGRVYSLEEMRKEVERINESFSVGEQLLGELDHPNRMDVHLSNVSHRITEIYMDGNKMMGKAEVLEKTQAGQILKGLIESGVRVGVSTRGSGKVENNGEVKNFTLRTVDAVATPSVKTAYPETLMEQLEAYRRGELVNDLAEAALYDKRAEEFLAKELKGFINSLEFNK